MTKISRNKLKPSRTALTIYVGTTLASITIIRRKKDSIYCGTGRNEYCSINLPYEKDLIEIWVTKTGYRSNHVKIRLDKKEMEIKLPLRNSYVG